MPLYGLKAAEGGTELTRGSCWDVVSVFLSSPSPQGLLGVLGSKAHVRHRGSALNGRQAETITQHAGDSYRSGEGGQWL